MQQLYSPGCTFILAPHETSIPLHPSFIHSVYSSEHWKAEHLRVLHELAYLFHSNQRMAGWRRSKGTRNRTLWEWCTMDSSCSTYRVGKVQSIFLLPVNKKLYRHSVIRCSVIPYSAFYSVPYSQQYYRLISLSVVTLILSNHKMIPVKCSPIDSSV